MKKKTLHPSLVVVISLLAIIGSGFRTRDIPGKIKAEVAQKVKSVVATEVQLDEAKDAGSQNVPLQGEVVVPKLVVPEALSMRSNQPPAPTMTLVELERMLKAKQDDLVSADVELSQLTDAARASTNFSYVVAFLNAKNLLIAGRDKLQEDIKNLAQHVAVAKMKDGQAASKGPQSGLTQSGNDIFRRFWAQRLENLHVLVS